MGFYEQRLYFAGSDTKPTTLWGSKSGDYERHTPGVKDDDPVVYTLTDTNPICWLKPCSWLLCGTAGSEWRLSSSSSDTLPITPTNITAKSNTAYGSAQVIPQAVGDVILFVQRHGLKVRELSLPQYATALVAQDVTILSEHITKSGIIETAYQRTPDQIFWGIRADGQLVGCTYERLQEVVAWHRHTTPGLFESVACIPGPIQDEVWVVVNRVIGGATKRCIEFIEDRDFGPDQHDCYFVDCGLSYDDSPVTEVSGLDYLEGDTVDILADGAVVAPQVVAAGKVTLPQAASVVHVGLPYISTLAPVRPEAGAQDGTSQGKMKRIHGAVVRLYRSLGLKLGPDADSLEEMPFRFPSDLMGAPPPLFTGDKKLAFDGAYDSDGFMEIMQDKPLPCTVLMICPRLTTYDDWAEE